MILMTNKLFSGICAGMTVLTGAFLLGVACTQEQPEIAVESLAIEEEGLVLFIGDSQQLHAVFTPDNATDRSVAWSIDRDDVATVNENGLVTAVAKGEAEVTATASGKTATCKVSVYDNIVSVTGVTLPDAVLTVDRGETRTLVATVEPADATNRTVSWTSSDPTVAFISQEGELQALKLGKTVITVTTEDGGFTATCDVTVDASEYTVTFETDGGTEIAPVVVKKNEKLVLPPDPQKGGVDEGLYPGTIEDPDAGTLSFGGWYTDETLLTPFDSESPVTSDLTLYAKWDGESLEPIDIGSDGDIVTRALTWLNALDSPAAEGYTLVLANDVTNPAFSADFNNPAVTVTLLGKGGERTISKTTGGNMFVIWGGTMILGNNIRITGSNYGNFYPIDLNGNDAAKTGGTLIMLDGSKISDITGATGPAGAVRIQSGQAKFIMRGGEISNNVLESTSADTYAGIIYSNWGPFTMEGGVICNNRVTTAVDGKNIAGAVVVSHNYLDFSKTGGEIRDNEAESLAAEPGNVAQQILYEKMKKVDADLEESDNLSKSDINTNPLWKSIE